MTPWWLSNEIQLNVDSSPFIKFFLKKFRQIIAGASAQFYLTSMGNFNCTFLWNCKRLASKLGRKILPLVKLPVIFMLSLPCVSSLIYPFLHEPQINHIFDGNTCQPLVNLPVFHVNFSDIFTVYFYELFWHQKCINVNWKKIEARKLTIWHLKVK